MKYNGKDVTYALFKARNDQLKLLIKSRRQDDRLKRIIATQTPPQGDYSRAVIMFDDGSMMTAKNLMHMVFAGHGAVTNPSFLDSWGGWHYEEPQTWHSCYRAMATKIGGRKNAFTVVKFTAWGQDSKGRCFIEAFVTIPTDFSESVKFLPSKGLLLKQIRPDILAVRKVGSEEDTKSMTLNFGYYCKEGAGKLTPVKFVITPETDELDYVFAFETLDASVAEGIIPKSKSGRYYNVWWKQNAKTTLDKRGDKFFEKDGAPMLVEFCIPGHIPDFVPKDKVHSVNGGYEYYPQNGAKQFAQWYGGIWIRHGEGRFQYIDQATPSAKSYFVVGTKGERYGNLDNYIDVCRAHLK